MSTTTCPVCGNENYQTFWHWDKEELLMRDWAMDTRVTFVICRDCSAIFQNPIVEKMEEDLSFNDWDGAVNLGSAQEPALWLKQFSPVGEKKGRVLEIYNKNKRFVDYLKENGWEKAKAVKVNDFLNDSCAGQGAEFGFESGDALELDEKFDVVYLFDVLSETKDPKKVLEKVRNYVDDDGGVFVEVVNPLILPRVDKLCLTSEEHVVYPFHTIIFLLHKYGFVNHGAEIGAKIRFYCKKDELRLTSDPAQTVPNVIWEQTSFRFQRNYTWMKLQKFFAELMQKVSVDQESLTKARSELHQDQGRLQVVRDVCGACLLFSQEVSTLRETISENWSHTMSRIFEILRNDYPMYDLFQLASINGLATFDTLERFHFNEKMVYMTDPSYFEKYFSEEEARRLCDSIIRAGQVVCGNLSSLL